MTTSDAKFRIFSDKLLTARCSECNIWHKPPVSWTLAASLNSINMLGSTTLTTRMVSYPSCCVRLCEPVTYTRAGDASLCQTFMSDVTSRLPVRWRSSVAQKTVADLQRVDQVDQTCDQFEIFCWVRGTPSPLVPLLHRLCSFLLFPFLSGFNCCLLLFIPFLSTRIVPLRFQSGGRRK